MSNEDRDLLHRLMLDRHGTEFVDYVSHLQMQTIYPVSDVLELGRRMTAQQRGRMIAVLLARFRLSVLAALGVRRAG